MNHLLLQALLSILPGKTHLRRLVLRENELGDEGAKFVAEGLQHLTNLQYLDLTQNQVSFAC